MKVHNLKHLRIILLTAAIALLGGADRALAGPGGGTYYANSPAGGVSGTALRKFVDSLPGLGYPNRNNLGQYIPVAVKDTTKYLGSDYYEIGLRDYRQKLHSDLPATTDAFGTGTKLRGYYQINAGDTPDPTVQGINQYLGPLIIAKKNRPVRIKFTNNLPNTPAGDLFIPVDTTLMGAGLGPDGVNKYTQNRAAIHLHGGNTPWISDGTPHQWTAPAAEATTIYLKGVSAKDVPDMPGTGPGELTLFWTNQQSGRLMFYHDHTYGLTRLNVYAGEAAGYLLWDDAEQLLITTGVLPNLGGVYQYGIPLIIQDKTFVPQNVNSLYDGSGKQIIIGQDDKWDRVKYPSWGVYGDLWWPHVYEPNQDPTSPAGANPFGRWDYGPWFWPPVIVDPANSVLPEPSTTPEGFHDTPIVNGTAYPYMQVEPKAYRFRILNAANDRTLNLSLFYADPANPGEVKMVPASPNAAYPATWPTDGRAGGVPDPATAGPAMIQIGNEGGLLPAPVVIPAQPVGFNYNRRDIVVLNVQEHALLLGPAERADIIVDFSKVPSGSKIILYNDGPAPLPAGDPRYDYYTGNPDQMAAGGWKSTVAGFGPNTRTIMQFQVSGTPSAPFNLAALQAALPSAYVASGQAPPIVPESAYNTAFGQNYLDTYSRISDYRMTLNVPDPVSGIPNAIPSTIEFNSKAIQELWDPYGRMNATLGVELPFTNNLVQTTLPMGYAEPATENLIDGQPQIWKITHNGVDTHPVHFHLFNVQVLNRVGWDGAIRPPDDNELGWKETVRMNPLEDVIVAFQPFSQSLPFPLPTSIRPIDPTAPVGSRLAAYDYANLDPALYDLPSSGTVDAAVLTTVRNTPPAGQPNTDIGYDYGFEYVWHCHILGHEENDFMRVMSFRSPTVAPAQPAGLAATDCTAGGGCPDSNAVTPHMPAITLSWNESSPDPVSGFKIQRAVAGSGAYSTIAYASFYDNNPPTPKLAGTPRTLTYVDNSVASGTTYDYRVIAYNTKGDSAAATALAALAPTWTGATGVTLIPSVQSPQPPGTPVKFTATATGASAGIWYQYQFLLKDMATGITTVVMDYGVATGGPVTWTMDGSLPLGTYSITVNVRTSLPGPDTTATIPWTVGYPPVNRCDFNLDGACDILWRNSSGQNAIWFMGGATGTTINSVAMLPTVDPSWSVAGTADFNKDGALDILWRNKTTGMTAVWFMNAAGTTVASVTALPAVDLNWSVAGLGDFNRDGTIDIIWRHTSGVNVVWLMGGATGTDVTSVALLPTVDLSWSLVGTGDFNKDSYIDLIWRNTSGVNVVWFMSGVTGTTVANIALLPTVDLSWTLSGTGDFNKDSNIDILWRNTSGMNVVWLMGGATGTSVAGVAPLPSVPAGWTLAGPR